MDVGTWQESPDVVPSHTLCNPHTTDVRGVDINGGTLSINLVFLLLLSTPGIRTPFFVPRLSRLVRYPFYYETTLCLYLEVTGVRSLSLIYTYYIIGPIHTMLGALLVYIPAVS